MSDEKIVVTHTGALRAKYGVTGVAQVRQALDKLVAADAKRGIATRVLAIDSAPDMAPYGKAAGSPASAREAKTAIDAIFAHDGPAYLMILGAPDVIPMQKLSNPVYEPGGDDDDRWVPSDLPYACGSPYSSDPNRFVGPARVVSRLPDIVGATSPAYLVKLLQGAAAYTMRNAVDYRRYFGLSAQVWKASTAQSLDNLFGDSAGMQTAPPSGPKWTKAQLAPRVHFINCHGSHWDINYYGQPRRKEEYPVSHTASWLPGKIAQGTVLAAECCYGAELYDPTKTQHQPGIAYTYLGNGAYGVFGSTTIAYGPSSGNDSADLICRYFLEAVMAGASLGRAALEARQRFAGHYSHLDAVNLKTLAQFYLLGDPSLHPATINPHALNKTKTFKSAFAHSKDSGPRTLRRIRLRRIGLGLQRDVPLLRAVLGNPPQQVALILRQAAKESGIDEHRSRNFHIVEKRGKAADGPRRSVHMLVSSGRNLGAGKARIKRSVVLVATVHDGKLMHLRRLHSR